MTALDPFPFRLARLQALRALATWALVLALTALPALARTERVEIGDRWYRVDLPAKSRGAPVILALHGGGGDPEQFARSSGLGAAGTARGFAVVFPAGTGRRGDRLLTWNGGYCCGSAAKNDVPDENFLKVVIADVAAQFGVDGSRVFVTGMSNGSIMAETFAARNPGLVAAVAGVSGTMDTGANRVRGPVPALIIHGTADSMVPYAGGQGDRSLTRAKFSSVASVVQAFLAAQPGVLAQTTRRIDDHDDGTAVAVTDWAAGGKVWLRLMTVEGGEHYWPGSRKARLSGGKTQEIDATAEILRFFESWR
jgi:polyhydroxybutyrate depolymerase